MQGRNYEEYRRREEWRNNEAQRRIRRSGSRQNRNLMCERNTGHNEEINYDPEYNERDNRSHFRRRNETEYRERQRENDSLVRERFRREILNNDENRYQEQDNRRPIRRRNEREYRERERDMFRGEEKDDEGYYEWRFLLIKNIFF